MIRPSTGSLNTDALPRNRGIRRHSQMKNPSTSGSKWEMWFGANTTPPERGMFSRPVNSGLVKVSMNGLTIATTRPNQKPRRGRGSCFGPSTGCLLVLVRAVRHGRILPDGRPTGRSLDPGDPGEAYGDREEPPRCGLPPAPSGAGQVLRGRHYCGRPRLCPGPRRSGRHRRSGGRRGRHRGGCAGGAGPPGRGPQRGLAARCRGRRRRVPGRRSRRRSPRISRRYDRPS